MTRKFSILFLAILISGMISGCAAKVTPLPKQTYFTNMTVPTESLERLPPPERFPKFVVVEDKDGAKHAAIPVAEMMYYEKMKEYVLASKNWSDVCNDSFNDSIIRTKSIIMIGQSTEAYTNTLIDRIDAQRQLLEDERTAHFWDNVKNYTFQILLGGLLIGTSL